MYTKTQVSPSTVEAITHQRALGDLLISNLRTHATLILTKEDVAQLRTLPTAIWVKLKDDLEKKRIKWRLVPDDEWQTVSDACVEVVLADSAQSDNAQPSTTDLANYADTPPVALRSSIREGSHSLRDREQFWAECLRPVIESTSPDPMNRRVHLVDQYAFHDAHRTLFARDGTLKNRNLLDSGLFWLISRLNSYGKNLPSRIDIIVTATETDDLDTDQAIDMLKTISKRIDMRNIVLTANIISGHENKRRPAGFISRQLIVGGNAHFQLSHGMRDFSLPRDQTALTGVFSPSSNRAFLDALTELRGLKQMTVQFSTESPTNGTTSH